MSYIGNSNIENWITPGVEFFSGNSSTTAFKLSRYVESVNDIQVVINGLVINPTIYYMNWGANELTFYTAPSTGTNNIVIRYLSRQTSLIAPAQGTVDYRALAIGAPEWNSQGDVNILRNFTVYGNWANVNTLHANSNIYVDGYYYGNAYTLTGINAESIDHNIVSPTVLGTGTANGDTYLTGASTYRYLLQTSFSGGNTGLTPLTTTIGNVVLGGTLKTANGGTGLTSFIANSAIYAINGSTLTSGTLPPIAGGTGLSSPTANSVVITNGASAYNTVSPGVANNILVSNGTNWVSGNVLDYGIATTQLAGGGRGTIITSSSTYTVPQGIRNLKVTCIGAGGGFVVSPNLLYGSRGGNGGIAVKYITGLSGGESVVVTVGSKGASINAYSGTANTGGTTSFGSHCTATGGYGGYYDYWGVAQDGGDGLGATGDFNITGQSFKPAGSLFSYGQGDHRPDTASIPNGMVLIEY